jgi:hypothetical protein
MCLLHHVQIDGRFDDTQHGFVATRRGTTLADIFFRESIAALAVANRSQGTQDGVTELLRSFPIVLKQMIGHPLRRLWPNPGQTAQRIDQGLETRWVHELRTAA